MYHYVYVTTVEDRTAGTKRYYVGKHSDKYLHNCYTGGGANIRRIKADPRYQRGEITFNCKPYLFFDNDRIAYEYEGYVVTHDLIAGAELLNINEGGSGLALRNPDIRPTPEDHKLCRSKFLMQWAGQFIDAPLPPRKYDMEWLDRIADETGMSFEELRTGAIERRGVIRPFIPT